MSKSLREQFAQSHPEFPFLAAGDVASVEEFLHERGWLASGETVQSCERAGEGNMNLTLRVRTGERSLILKQARPWVEKYDHIPAPWDRMLFEKRFYERVANISEVAARMPALLRSDSDTRTLLLEDAGTDGDFTDLYRGGFMAESELIALGTYLGALHSETCSAPDSKFANREMRTLNHQHIFEVPLDPNNGLDLDQFEPGLSGVARELANDNLYCNRVKELGDRYLQDGNCLVHGDFFPGSWLRTPRGPKVIDGEFCFYGDPDFDVGVAIAHFALARRPVIDVHEFLSAYGHPASDRQTTDEHISRYAAVEVMRRLMGVAQLPIAKTDGFRAGLLQRSREAMMRKDWKELFK